MSDDLYNPTDPLFLLSRSLDEPLTDEDRLRLNEFMQSGAASRVDAQRFLSLNRLLRDWKSQNSILFDRELPDRVLAAIRANPMVENRDDSLEDLLSQWRKESPAIDWVRFQSDVMCEIRREERFSKSRRLVFRMGVPLAAAAAIAFAFLIPRQTSIVPRESIRAEIRTQVTLARPVNPNGLPFQPEASSRVTVSYGRLSVGPERVELSRTMISSAWAGADGETDAAEELPPL